MDPWLPPNLGPFAALVFLVCLTPGPAVLFTVSQAAWRGPKAGFAAALGINAGNLVYYALSALGLLAVIAASGTAFMILKWAGVGYLAWLGLSAIRGSFRDAPEQTAPPLASASFRDAAIVQLANPKAVLYFLALLPQFIDPTRSVPAQTTVLALVGCSIEMIVLSGYVLSASVVRGGLARAGVRRWMERGTGVAFLGLAAATALWRRTA